MRIVADRDNIFVLEGLDLWLARIDLLRRNYKMDCLCLSNPE